MVSFSIVDINNVDNELYLVISDILSCLDIFYKNFLNEQKVLNYDCKKQELDDIKVKFDDFLEKLNFYPIHLFDFTKLKHKFIIKYTACKILIGDDVDFQKAINSISFIENNIEQFSSEDSIEASDEYNDLLPFILKIYFEYCKNSYCNKLYDVVIDYFNKIEFIKINNKEIFDNNSGNEIKSNLCLYYAESNFYNGNFDISFEYYDKSINLCSTNPNNYIKKSFAKFMLKDYIDSKNILTEYLSKGFDIDNDILRIIYTNLVKICIELSDTIDAKKYLFLLEKIANENFEILYLKGRIYYIEKNYDLAVQMHRKAECLDKYNSMNEIYLGLSLSKNKRNDIAYKYLKKGISLQLSEIQTSDIPSSLYIYRPISDMTYQLLEGEYLTFSSVDEFNDPLDSRYFIEAVEDNEIKNVLNDLKIRCFSANNNCEPLNTLMWAHYADKHKGIALEYEFLDDFKNMLNKNFHFYKVKYENTLVSNMQIIDFNDYVKAFFTKEPLWKYENEYRLLTFKDELTDGFKLNNCVKLKSITFGYKTDDNDKKRIKDIFKYKSFCNFYEIVVPDIKITPFKFQRKKA